MIIEIKGDGHGAWNLTAKDHADAWPPLYMAYGRSTWQTCALVRGILTDFQDDAPTTEPDHARLAAEQSTEV